MKIEFRIILTVVMMLHALSAYPYNMRQTSNRDGLSNSAILSMSQDDDGYLWLGTCDGVNIADGRSVNSFSQIFPGSHCRAISSKPCATAATARCGCLPITVLI